MAGTSKINWITIILLLILTTATAFSIQGKKVGEQCTMQDGSTGTCIHILRCIWYLHGRNTGEVKESQLKICSFAIDNAIICCGPDPSAVTTSAAVGRSNYIRDSSRACGHYTGSRGDRIVGGYITLDGEFPHMALLMYENAGAVCGGTIISEQHILTAAHCLDQRVSKLVSVLVGENELVYNTSNMYQVESFTSHENYSPNSPYNDIGVIKLKTRLNFSARVYPACLYNDEDDPQGVLWATGWGWTEHQTILNRLLKVNLTANGLTECRNKYSEFYKSYGNPFYAKGISDTQLCAEGRFGQDTCAGDSGGPLQIKYDDGSLPDIVGIVSFGERCGREPAVYTRVAKYISWIEQHVTFDVPENEPE